MASGLMAAMRQHHWIDGRRIDGSAAAIRRETLEQDFTIYQKRGEEWVDCGLDQAVKEVNFAEFKRLGLLIKKIIDADQWLA